MLEKVIDSSQLLKIERKVLNKVYFADLKAKISRSLAIVLVHDLLCSKQGIAAATGPIKDAILRHKTRLKSDHVRAQLSRGEKNECKYPYMHW